MILIDTNKSIQDITLTLTESSLLENPKYLMVLKNDASREVFKLFLPANSSDFPERYDLFIVDTSAYSGLDLGYYTFHIYEQVESGNMEDESLLGDAVEEGKLFILNTKEIAPVDEYIVYNIK